jgi:hypothetical protein
MSVVALFAAALVPPAAVPPAELTAPVKVEGLVAADLFMLAERAVAGGRPEDAQEFLTALLSDPDPDVRLEAGFRLAKLDAAGGRNREAAVRLRRILDERPDAQPVRLELAAQLAGLGDITAARRELRYAQAGSLPPEVAQMVDRFSQALRSRKPYGGSLQLGMSADSNVNRATRSDTLGTVIGDFTLDEDAQERSGQGLSVDGQAYFRVPFARHQFTVVGSQSADLYRHKQFNDTTLGIKAGPELSFGPMRLDLSVGYNRRWFGGERFTDSAIGQAVLTSQLNPQTQGQASVTAAKVTNRRNSLESGFIYSGGIGIERALSVRTGLGLSLSAVRQDFRDSGYSTRSGQLAVIGYQSFGRVTLVGSVSLGRLVADDRLSLYPERRREWSKRLSLGSTFRRVEWMGFSPSMQLSWERNRSSIEIYDYRRRAFEFGVARAF